jgi:hypothetical protein
VAWPVQPLMLSRFDSLHQIPYSEIDFWSRREASSASSVMRRSHFTRGQCGKRHRTASLSSAIRAFRTFDLRVRLSAIRIDLQVIDRERFHESCHKRGIHLCFGLPIRGLWGIETKDGVLWQRGVGRLSCRSEMRIWRG